MKNIPTYQANIYTGLKEGYSGTIHDVSEVAASCQEYVDAVGLCVSVTTTQFIYTDGTEPGAIVGLIAYPRFPAKPEVIKRHALTLAEKLLTTLRQQRISVVCSDETIMLEKGVVG